MSHQSSNVGGDGSWNGNVKKGLKVEIPLKFKWFSYRLLTYYTPCFYRIDFVVIPFYIELPWSIIRGKNSQWDQ